MMPLIGEPTPAAANFVGQFVFVASGSASTSLLGGTSPYSFNSSICADASTNLASAEEDATCTVSLNGTYTNFTCGTGILQGSVTLTTLYGVGFTTYTILVVGGVGVMEGGSDGVVTVVGTTNGSNCTLTSVAGTFAF